MSDVEMDDLVGTKLCVKCGEVSWPIAAKKKKDKIKKLKKWKNYLEKTTQNYDGLWVPNLIKFFLLKKKKKKKTHKIIMAHDAKSGT